MILTKELKKKLVKKLDDLIKLPVWAEPFDSLVLNIAINYLDDNYGDKIPEKLKDDFVAVAEAFVIDDYEAIIDVIPAVINDIVDIPGLDEDLEGKFLAINLKATLEFIKFVAEKRK